MIQHARANKYQSPLGKLFDAPTNKSYTNFNEMYYDYLLGDSSGKSGLDLDFDKLIRNKPKKGTRSTIVNARNQGNEIRLHNTPFDNSAKSFSKIDHNVIGGNSPMVDKLNFYLNESIHGATKNDAASTIADVQRQKQKREEKYARFLEL